MAVIPTDLATRTRLILDSQVQALAATPEIQSELPAVNPGQRISARLESALANGSFRAIVDGKMVNLTVSTSNPGKPVEQLSAIGPGQTLELVVTGKNQRTIFTRVAEQTNADTPVLSRSAQLIASLLARGNPGPAPLAKGAPLMQTPGPEAFRALPQQLRQAVAESGLFYESHQAQWLEGKIPAESLLREPQGSHSPLAALLQAKGSPQASAQNLLPAQARSPNIGGDNSAEQAQLSAMPGDWSMAAEESATPRLAAAGLPFRLLQGVLLYESEQTRWQGTAAHPPQQNPSAPPQPGSERPLSQPPGGTSAPAVPLAALLQPLPPGTAPAHGGESASSPTTNPTPAQAQPSGPMPTELQPLVQQQLDAADSRQLLWQGQVWPGQNMEWRIEEDQEGARSDGEDEDQPKQWKTSLRLTMPNLGSLNATLTLNASGVSVILATDRVQALRDAAPVLADSLAAVGVPPLSVQVVPHEQA